MTINTMNPAAAGPWTRVEGADETGAPFAYDYRGVPSDDGRHTAFQHRAAR